MKNIVFIMPYGIKKTSTGEIIDFDKRYIKYKGELKSDKYKIHRVDNTFGSDIKAKMWSMIKYADIVVADLTSYNPNVMYELGARHVFKDKITIMVNDRKDSIPFDINDFTIIERKELKITIDKSIKLIRNFKDSPIRKHKMKKRNVFKNYGNDIKKFKKQAKEYKESEDFEDLYNLCNEKYLHLSGIDIFDSFYALSLYKVFPNELKQAKEILDKYYPLSSNDYEIVGLYASITRKIYEKSGTKEDKAFADDAALYMYDCFSDSYAISSYYTLKLALAEKSEITFQELVYEFKNAKERLINKNKSKDSYYEDTLKTINYVIHNQKQTPNFSKPKSSIPIIKRINELKGGKHEKNIL